MRIAQFIFALVFGFFGLFGALSYFVLVPVFHVGLYSLIALLIAYALIRDLKHDKE